MSTSLTGVSMVLPLPSSPRLTPAVTFAVEISSLGVAYPGVGGTGQTACWACGECCVLRYTLYRQGTRFWIYFQARVGSRGGRLWTRYCDSTFVVIFCFLLHFAMVTATTTTARGATTTRPVTTCFPRILKVFPTFAILPSSRAISSITTNVGTTSSGSVRILATSGSVY